MVIVPTSYPNFKEEEMKRLGIKMVIYANQGLRAAIKNTNAVLEHISKHGIGGIEMNVASMQEVFEIQGMFKMKEDEKKFLKSEKGDVKVIIPAAGDISQEESFKDKDLLSEIPVTMLDINGKSILQRAVENLNNIGLQNITVVSGYKGNKISLQGIEKVENANYHNSGIIDSVLMASGSGLGEKNLVVYSDILFDKEIIEKLLKSAGDIVLVIDSSYQENRFPKKDLDLVIAKYPPLKEERFLNNRAGNQILKIGKGIPRAEANYEFCGMALLSKKGFEILKQEHEKLKQIKPVHHFGLIDVLQQVIDSGFLVEAVETHGGWTEIKNFEDYKRACRLLVETA